MFGKCYDNSLDLHPGVPKIGIEFDAVDFADLMLEDTDFLLLFDRSLDGIEYQTDTTLKHLGIPSLHPENWFDPYDDSRLWWEEND